MDVKDKILKFKELKGLSNPQLAELLGVSRSLPGKWESGDSYPSRNKLPQFAKAMGMTLDDLISEKDLTESTSVREPKTLYLKPEQGLNKKIPFYDTIAVGGQAMLADQTPISEPAEYVDPGDFFRKATGVITVYGHSGFPKYPAGCKVAFRDASKDLIYWGEDYVVETEERRIIKRLERHEDRTFVKAVSYNKSDAYVYADIDIPIEKIKRLYMVLGKIELEASV